MGKKAKTKRKTLIDSLVRLYPERDREWLYSRILHGDIKVNGHRERDSKQLIASDAIIEADFDQLETSADSITPGQYVSRGGDKLAPVLAPAEQSGFLFRHKYLLDAGASTGGFTDCLLRHGAAGVHAVDVGYNQLDYRLRQNDRVFVHERCNIMGIEKGELQPAPEAAVADLAFRSMEGAARKIISILEPGSGVEPLLLALIKPQFELEYSGLKPEDFTGVLEDGPLLHDVLENTRSRLEAEGLRVKQQWPAGISGTKGNQEYFWLISAR